jgi:Fe-S oxidoreductase/FAD/FMN-containing dehydrogenase
MPKEKVQNLVRDDLRDVVRGELSISPVTLASFAGDAGVWEQKPLAMVAPREETEVVAVLVYAAEQGLSVHPRGAGQGVTGECLGAGIVLDCSRHLRRLVDIGPDWITVQAGATLAEVNSILGERGRRLSAVPSGSEESTIGGWISSLGRSASPVEGTVADQILHSRLALADGSILELGPRPMVVSDETGEADPDESGLMARLTRIAQWRMDLCDVSSDHSLADQSGMVLAGLMDSRQRILNPQRILAGARGTLGVILEATLRTVPVRRWSAWAVIGFDLPERAADQCLKLPCLDSLESAEIIDWRSIALACDHQGELKSFFPDPTPVAAVVRWGVDDEISAERIVGELQLKFQSNSAYIRTQVVAQSQHPLGQWRFAARSALGGRPGAALTRPVFESITVKPEAVSALLSQIAAASQMARLNVGMTVSPLTGRIVVDPIFDPTQSIDEQQIAGWLDSLADLTLKSNGFIRGVEPWLRRVRGSALTRQFADLRPVWREIKTSFDTGGRLNPEALPGESRPDLKLRVLSIPAGPNPMLNPALPKSKIVLSMLDSESTIDSFPFLPVLEPDLSWPEDRGPQLAASACNSCGACRSVEPTSRMCPSFRGDRSESSSPRALAGLIRQVTAGTIDPTLWGSEQVKEAAEACFHCQMCRSECPAGVDISGLMIEAKAAAVANHGLAPKDFWLSRVDVLARMSSFFPVIANAILSHGQSRWLLEKVTGLSKHRRLPAVRRWSFIHRADSRGWCRPRPQMQGPRVALFLDILTNHFDQDLAETTVEFLKWAGVNVYVPSRQRSSGMPALVVGDLDRARELVRANLRVLGNAVRDGYTIVCIEPTSAMVIRDFYPRLTDDLDARLVADNTLELSTYLAGMAERGLLPESRHILHGRIGYHQPCHLRALDVGKPGFDLVKRVPGVSLEFIDKGCSGIAGPFGFSRSNFRKSLRIGHQLRARLKDDDIDVGMTECLSCRMQMEQGITKRSHHPVEILAMAAGLNPELRAVWNQPKARNTIT